MIDLNKRATEISDTLYIAYGTDNGALFGIPAKYRHIIITIIRLTLKIEEKEWYINKLQLKKN